MSSEESNEEGLSFEDGDNIVENNSDNEDLNDDLESSSEDEDQAKIPENKKVYNSAALLQKLKEIQLEGPQGKIKVPWMEKLVINSGFIHEDVTAEDDFKREMSFYRQALAGCVEAKVKFDSQSFKYKRPDDYFAEMLKTDSHMAKVRQNLLEQQKRIDVVEERRRQRELKRFGKKVQVEKEQQKAKQKNQEIDAVKKWRKDQKNKITKTNEGDDLEKIIANASKPSDSSEKKPNLKRKRKDETYGFGGVQKKAKKNSSESSADLSAFSSGRNKSIDRDLLPLVPGFGAGRARGFGSRGGGGRGGGRGNSRGGGRGGKR